jgi:hypothetical protein
MIALAVSLPDHVNYVATVRHSRDLSAA